MWDTVQTNDRAPLARHAVLSTAVTPSTPTSRVETRCDCVPALMHGRRSSPDRSTHRRSAVDRRDPGQHRAVRCAVDDLAGVPPHADARRAELEDGEVVVVPGSLVTAHRIGSRGTRPASDSSRAAPCPSRAWPPAP